MKHAPLNLSLITAPLQEPVEVDQVKVHLRITDPAEDSYLQDLLIPSARMSVEHALGRALITQTWEWVFDGGFPAATQLRMPWPPFLSVTFVKYVDTDGTTQTWASSNYATETRGTYGRLFLADGITWPVDLKDSFPGVAWVRWDAGYGTEGEDVPASMRHLVLLMCGHMYEHRDPTVTGTIIARVPMAWRDLVMQNRALTFEHWPT